MPGNAERHPPGQKDGETVSKGNATRANFTASQVEGRRIRRWAA